MSAEPLDPVTEHIRGPIQRKILEIEFEKREVRDELADLKEREIRLQRELFECEAAAKFFKVKLS